MTIGNVRIHRSEQWDLGRAITKPLIVIHLKRSDPRKSHRIFCIWAWGVQIGSLYFTRWPGTQGERP